MKICCVTGPREIPKDRDEYVRQALRHEMEQSIKEGFIGFLSSMLNNVDLEFAALVTEKKQEHSELYLEAVIPYADRMESKNKRFKELINQCDGVKLISQERDRDCFFARNRYFIEHSSRVIAVSDGRPKSDTAQIIRMATARGLELRIIDISDNKTE